MDKGLKIKKTPPNAMPLRRLADLPEKTQGEI